MRRKRCSRPSLTEPTSGRCNYDLEWSRNFLFFFSFSTLSLFFIILLTPLLLPFWRSTARLYREWRMSFRAWQRNSRQNLANTVVASSSYELSCCLNVFIFILFSSLLQNCLTFAQAFCFFALRRSSLCVHVHVSAKIFSYVSVRRSYRYWIAAFVIGEVDLI